MRSGRSTTSELTTTFSLSLACWDSDIEAVESVGSRLLRSFDRLRVESSRIEGKIATTVTPFVLPGDRGDLQRVSSTQRLKTAAERRKSELGNFECAHAKLLRGPSA